MADQLIARQLGSYLPVTTTDAFGIAYTYSSYSSCSWVSAAGVQPLSFPFWMDYILFVLLPAMHLLTPITLGRQPGRELRGHSVGYISIMLQLLRDLLLHVFSLVGVQLCALLYVCLRELFRRDQYVLRLDK